MSGNPDNASIWADADVYVGPIDAENPATIDDPFPVAWGLAGLLDGDAGFEESRSQDSTDYFGWGGILIRTARKNFKLQRKFTALEENAVTLDLVWPGSGPGERVVPKRAPRKFGFETVDGDKKQRVITRKHGEVSEVGAIKDSESELRKYEITLDIYPDGDGVLFDVQPIDAAVTLESISMTPSTLALANNAIGAVTVVATFSDASTLDVTHLVAYTSDQPTRATAEVGYVTAHAADGVAVITATYHGETDTTAVTVS